MVRKTETATKLLIIVAGNLHGTDASSATLALDAFADEGATRDRPSATLARYDAP